MLALLTSCSDEKVVMRVERVWPSGPPVGACEPQPTPPVAGVLDWKLRGLIYAGVAAEALKQLALCDQWIKGWKADEAAAKAKP